MTIRAVLLCFLFTSFASCNGQSTSTDVQDKSTLPGSTIQIGEDVSEINGNPNVIFQDSKNKFWFGVKKRGVYTLDEKGLVFYSTKDGLCGNDILGIQEDKFGNIYFDTFKGVSRFDGNKFTTLKIIEGKSFKNEWKLEPDDLWFRMGWDKSGPYRYDGEYLFYLELPKTEQADNFYAKYPNVSFNPYGIYSLYKDNKGNVWFGTSSLGVCRYDGEKVSWIYEEEMTTIPGGGALGIRSTLEDKEGYFWFTNSRYYYDILPASYEQNGTSYINYKKHDVVGYSKYTGEIDYPYFMSIVEDDDGELWMATYSEGVWRNSGKELIHYPVKDGKSDVLIFAIYKDRQGMLWLITESAGVYRYNGSVFEKLEISKRGIH